MREKRGTPKAKAKRGTRPPMHRKRGARTGNAARKSEAMRSIQRRGARAAKEEGTVMNQIATGAFIARKRKEANLTQAQLAERLGISSKSISKWERGKCMPDYSVVNELCTELDITVSELLDGEENEKENLRMYDNDQILEMLARIQRLEQQRVTIIAIALIVMGIALLAVSPLIGGSDVIDFFSGALFGIGLGEIIIGVFLATRSIFGYLVEG